MRNMNKILISIVLIISLMGYVSALDGSDVKTRPGEVTAEGLFNYGFGQPWVGGNLPSYDASDIYSQYYSIPTGSSPKKHIEAPKKGEIKDKTPTTVYFSYQMQAMPYTQYQTYATYTGGNSLWIQGSSSWTQYAKVPQGSSLSLMATSSAGGNGNIYEIHPDGMLYKNTFYFYPGYNQIDFYADSVGQHILLIAIDGQISNSIVIDVTSYTPPSYQQPVLAYPPTQTQTPDQIYYWTNYSSTYYPYYYPNFNSFPSGTFGLFHGYYALQAANGQYVSAENGGGGAVVANRNAIGARETFKLIDRENGYYALQAANGQYVCAENGGGGAVVANRNAIGAWETFKLIDRENGYYALQAANGQYVCAESSGGGAVVANRNAIGAWETFKLIPR